MRLKYLCLAGAFFAHFQALGVHAKECGAMHFDAYGTYDTPCQKDPEKPRAYWSGMVSIVPKNIQPEGQSQDQSLGSAGQNSWSIRTIAPQNTHRVDVYSGSKTPRAGHHDIMTIALLTDIHGNPAPDGAPATFVADISEAEHKSADESINGIAIWLLEALANSADGYIYAQSNGLQSKRTDFHIISAEATQLTIIPPKQAEFSAKSQVALTAIDIEDTFGNHKEDGALVRFQSIGGDGSKSFVQGIISNHRATAFPYNGGNAQFDSQSSQWTAHIGRGESAPVTINTKQQMLKPIATLSVEQDLYTNTMRLKAGPFHTQAGHRVIDGTPIQFLWRDDEAADATEFTTTGYMVDGWAHAVMPLIQKSAHFVH